MTLLDGNVSGQSPNNIDKVLAPGIGMTYNRFNLIGTDAVELLVKSVGGGILRLIPIPRS